MGPNSTWDRIQRALHQILNGKGFQGLPVGSDRELLAIAKLRFPNYSEQFLKSEIARLRESLKRTTVPEQSGAFA